MRIVIDIPDKQLKELAQICVSEKRSRASLIREAIAAYMANRQPKAKQSAFEDACGLWGDKKIDGVEYQRKLRDE